MQLVTAIGSATRHIAKKKRCQQMNDWQQLDKERKYLVRRVVWLESRPKMCIFLGLMPFSRSRPSLLQQALHNTEITVPLLVFGFYCVGLLLLFVSVKFFYAGAQMTRLKQYFCLLPAPNTPNAYQTRTKVKCLQCSER
jgi:hypothetical protein